MTATPDAVACLRCGTEVGAAGPVVAMAGANGFDGPAFIPFVDQADTLGTGGVVHVDCFVSSQGRRAFAELLHAPKARAMGSD
ncbi:MAG TPA: hypothetical protein VMQ59_07695, partial [Acidimicrobiales bacterium]|jgi:hypothetical protein|nr:hypothetical protein [Acidimicrobiales bacterium]